MFGRKPKHIHDWELVAVNDTYHTTYTDTGQTKYWQMRFYKCNCNSRKFEHDLPAYTSHRGLDQAQKNWIDVGVVPTNSYHPADKSNYVKIDDIDRKKLDPVLEYQKTLEEMTKTLRVVLNRDFELEARYPKLKEAADEYHRRLDKYRNFDSLKEKDVI